MSKNKIQWKEQVNKTEIGKTLEMKVHNLLLEGGALSEAQ